jgi:hypothetical protein
MFISGCEAESGPLKNLGQSLLRHNLFTNCDKVILRVVTELWLSYVLPKIFKEPASGVFRFMDWVWNFIPGYETTYPGIKLLTRACEKPFSVFSTRVQPLGVNIHLFVHPHGWTHSALSKNGGANRGSTSLGGQLQPWGTNVTPIWG